MNWAQAAGILNFEFWILNWGAVGAMRAMGWVRVRAAKGILNFELGTSYKLAPAGVWATWAIMGLVGRVRQMGRVGRVGRVGRGENYELWIGHKLQACASGGGKKRIFDNERGGSLEESYFINNHPLERDDIQGQLGPADCAITCFHRVLSDLGIESSMRDMAAAMNYDPVAGCNIFKIPDAINSLGIENVNAEAGPLNTNELQKHLSSGKKAIVSVNNQQGAHAIIVDDISNGKVTIRDPLPVGRGSAYQIPVSEFEAAWLRNGAGKAVILGQ